jgi:hypothetical protein
LEPAAFYDWRGSTEDVVRRYRSRISLALAIISIAFTSSCLILPEVATTQTIEEVGPTAPYGAANYTFSGYVIPPVPANSQIVVAIDAYLPYSLTFSMFPTAAGNLAPTGPALLVLSNFTGAPFRVSVTVPAAEPYAIFITSINRTAYAIAIKGTWSLFYVLRGYVFVGFLASFACILATYYLRALENRKVVEEEAIREATSHEPARAATRLLSTQS